MSYIHQEDDRSEKLWSRVSEERNGKCNIFLDFELLIVEFCFQDEVQTTLGDMFAQVNMKEGVNARIAKS